MSATGVILENKAIGILRNWLVPDKKKKKDAISLYQDAANVYMNENNYRKASECCVRVAQLSHQINELYDAGISYEHAGNLLNKIDHSDREMYWDKAIELYRLAGKSTSVARLADNISARYSNDKDYDKAIKYYKITEEVYEGDGKVASMNKMKKSIAYLFAQKGDYHNAHTYYDSIGLSLTHDRIGQITAKKYLYNSLIAVMAVDYIGCCAKIKEYKEQCFRFGSTRETRTIESLSKALLDNDKKSFIEIFNGLDHRDNILNENWHQKAIEKAYRVVFGNDIVQDFPIKKSIRVDTVADISKSKSFQKEFTSGFSEFSGFDEFEGSTTSTTITETDSDDGIFA